MSVDRDDDTPIEVPVPRRLQSADDRALRSRARSAPTIPTPPPIPLEFADTVPDSDGVPQREIPEEVTAVTELMGRLDTLLDDVDQRTRRAVEAAFQVMWQHVRNEAKRQSNRVLAVAEAKVGADVPDRLAKAEAAIAKAEATIRRLAGEDEKNGRVGRVEDVAKRVANEVRNLADAERAHDKRLDEVATELGHVKRQVKLWRRVVAAGAAAIAGSVISIASWLVSVGDQQGSSRVRLDRVEDDVTEVRAAQRELWRRLFNAPAWPAPPGGIP